MFLTIILSLILIFAILLMLYSGVALIQDRRLFGSAPKDVQEALLDHDERFKGAHLIGWILFIIAILSFLAAFLYGGYDGIVHGWGLWDFFLRFIIMLYAYKLFDMVFFDWYLLTKSNFYTHYYPEAKGCASLDKFGFNFNEQLIKIILFPFLALFLAWICTLL